MYAILNLVLIIFGPFLQIINIYIDNNTLIYTIMNKIKSFVGRYFKFLLCHKKRLKR